MATFAARQANLAGTGFHLATVSAAGAMEPFAGGHILHDKPAFWASDSYAPATPVRTPVTMPLDSADRSRIASRVNGGRIIVDRAYLVSAADYRSAA
ncbi:hypothetical protein NKH92_24500 [Mesorhizobium sp. M0871]|uniref:hypothetical protein n=1 Tax=unclassified Mesorhizobium TaxID=325217 RepID=UPI0003CE55D4|nr:hypothetical protein [Mesorhizobium sp. LSHC412B00]ESX84910.1 hypothetical protein X756_23940 [Mesorhizobium sp. LSHC412B00]